MKKLLLIVAQKMEPGIVQNIIARLASKTPAMFVRLQLLSGGIATVLAAIIEALTMHQIPDFAHEDMVIGALKFIAAIVAGIAASCSLHTTDENLHAAANS